LCVCGGCKSSSHKGEDDFLHTCVMSVFGILMATNVYAITVPCKLLKKLGENFAPLLLFKPGAVHHIIVGNSIYLSAQ
jgi:hypothetical protein